MSVTMEKTGVNQAKLTITVDNEAYDAAMQKAYLKVRNNVNIPGFRKGKAPRQVIVSFYSEAVFYDEACDIAIPVAYDNAIEEQGLITVDRPKIDVIDVGAGKGIVFTADITLKPEVTLGQYKLLPVEKVEYPVTEEEIDAELKRAQDRVARWVEVDRPIQHGDRIMLDYAGTTDGVAFQGGMAENQALEIGSNRFIPGFEEQLIGMAKDEEGEIKVKFPEEYHAEELAGKDALFAVKIREIKGKEVPQMDDEFAKDVSEFDTLQAYKDSILARLEETNKRKSENEYNGKLVDGAVENAEVEIPQCMIDRQAERMVREFEYRLSYQGIKMEDYLKMTGMTRDAVKEQNLLEAEKTVKASLILEAIQKAENIEATEEDFEAEYAIMAETQKKNIEEIKETAGEEDKEYIRENIIMQKTFKLLGDSAAY